MTQNVDKFRRLQEVILEDEGSQLNTSELESEESASVKAFELWREEAIEMLQDDRTEGFVLSATQDWEHQTVIYGDKVPEFYGHGDLVAAAVIEWVDHLLDDGLDPDEVRRMFAQEILACVEVYLEAWSVAEGPRG